MVNYSLPSQMHNWKIVLLSDGGESAKVVVLYVIFGFFLSCDGRGSAKFLVLYVSFLFFSSPDGGEQNIWFCTLIIFFLIA